MTSRTHLLVHPGYAERNSGWHPDEEEFLKRYGDYRTELSRNLNAALKQDETLYVLYQKTDPGEALEFLSGLTQPITAQQIDELIPTTDGGTPVEDTGEAFLEPGHTDEVVLHGEIHGKCTEGTRLYLEAVLKEEDYTISRGVLFPQEQVPIPSSRELKEFTP